METQTDEDKRPAWSRKIDLLIDQLNRSAENIGRLEKVVEDLSKRSSQTQTVIHKTEGAGPLLIGLLIGALVACFATWVGILVQNGDIRDLKAWRDIHAAKIARLEAQQEKPK